MTEYTKETNVFVNDYAHHPTEIKAIYNSLSLKYPDKKLIAVFQPHTFSRTDAFLNNYIESLRMFDEIYIMPIFSSVREEECNKWLLLDSDCEFKKYDRSIKNELLKTKNNVIAFIGAGDIDTEFYFFIN
jgi:UDP-N-acetylmuramate--alanine ligase